MFTQCPNCETHYRLNVGELKIGHGQIKCTRCENIFDALKSLGETVVSTIADDYAAIPELEESQVVRSCAFEEPRLEGHESVPWAQPIPVKSFKSRFFWAFGNLTLLAVLIVQIFFVYGEILLKNPIFRTRLIETCTILDCIIPVYRNVSGIEVIDHTMFPDADRIMQFQLTIANRTAFEQPVPPIRLSLLTFTGDTMASRVFIPSEYTSSYSMETLMPLQKPLEVNLKIVKPEGKIGGYQFKLLKS